MWLPNILLNVFLLLLLLFKHLIVVELKLFHFILMLRRIKTWSNLDSAVAAMHLAWVQRNFDDVLSSIMIIMIIPCIFWLCYSCLHKLYCKKDSIKGPLCLQLMWPTKMWWKTNLLMMIHNILLKCITTGFNWDL